MEVGGFGLLNELCYVVPCLFVYLNVNYKAGFPFLWFRAPLGLLRLNDSLFYPRLGRSGTTFPFSGACLFRRPRRVALYRSRRSSAPSGKPVTRGDWAILARNSDLLMPLTFLHFITFRGNRGLEGSVPIVSKKWSDMYMLSTLTEITSVLGLDKTECPKCNLLHASAQWQTDQSPAGCATEQNAVYPGRWAYPCGS